MLGWHSQVEAMIRGGKLVRIGEMEIPAPGAFYITWDEARSLSEAAERLRDWLTTAGRIFTEPRSENSA